LGDQDPAKSKKALLIVVRAILAGSIGIIEGSRYLSSLRLRFDSVWTKKLINFAGIDSETDELPLGSVRQFWAPSALADKDQQILKYEGSIRESTLETCRSLERDLKNDLLASLKNDNSSGTS
jgi:hypothetical protein